MDEALHVTVDGEHARRAFGMLAGFILMPESTEPLFLEFAELPIDERISLLAATRTLWHSFTKDAAVLGAYDGSTEVALRVTREQTDRDYGTSLPSAVRMAHLLDDALSLRGLAFISAPLVQEIEKEPARALGALGYFLRAAGIAVCACAAQRSVTVEDLMAAIGQQLALSA